MKAYEITKIPAIIVSYGQLQSPCMDVCTRLSWMYNNCTLKEIISQTDEYLVSLSSKT